MLGKILIKAAIRNMMMNPKSKAAKAKSKAKRQRTKQLHRKHMVKEFGKLRYYLSWWFGDWVLYTCNRKFYQQPAPEPEYQKYYTDEKVAKRYMRMQQKKYDTVEITPVYSGTRKLIGYRLTANGKKATPATQQVKPLNVIPFARRGG